MKADRVKCLAMAPNRPNGREGALSLVPGSAMRISRKRRHPNEITCQAPRRTRHARSDSVCGKRLHRAARPVEPTLRLLADIGEADQAAGCVASWCKDCGVASEYRYVNLEDVA